MNTTERATWMASGIVIATLALPAPGAVGESQEAGPDAKGLYLRNCSSCHVKDGKGNPVLAKAFKLAPEALSLVDQETLSKSDKELVGVIREGKGKMPAYKGRLNDLEVAAILSYIRSLVPKQKQDEALDQPGKTGPRAREADAANALEELRLKETSSDATKKP